MCEVMWQLAHRPNLHNELYCSMNESPFQRKRTVFKREATTYESFRDYVKTKVNDMFMAYLPSDDIKAMSPEFLYPIGIFTFLSLLGIFLAVFLNGYYTSTKTQYLSPVTGAESSASKHCVDIPTTNTGTYLATESGYWQGTSGFSYGEATYSLSLTSLSASVDHYTLIMYGAYIQLLGVANYGVKNDLGNNLVYWMSGVLLPVPGNIAQRFSFVGTPLVIFDRQKVVGTLANVYGSCNATNKATFNSKTGKITLQYDYYEYMDNDICTGIINPDIIGYLGPSDKQDFSMQFDVRTMITAVAINLGITGTQYLVKIPAFDTNYTFEGVTYNVSSYYDPKYYGMDPVTCIQVHNYNITNGYTQCLVLIEDTVYAIPIFNHYGRSINMPIPCNCSEIEPEQLLDKYFSCNLFAFISGVLFYPTTSPDDVVRLFLELGLQQTPAGLRSPANQLAFKPMFMDSFFGETSENATLFADPVYREEAYSFCNVSGTQGPCAFVTFTLFDRNPVSWTISDYYFQLQNGACTNSFVRDFDTWTKLIENPFAPLVQDYQKCHYDSHTVVINQAGSSVGTVSILAPLCVAFILVLVYYSQVCGLFVIKKTYTETEKKHALDDLALKLLLARDRDKANLEKGSVLARLVEELGQELDEGDNIYHTGDNNSSSQPAVSVDWTSLKAAVGIKKRQLDDAEASGSEKVGSAKSSASTVSAATIAAISAKQEGLEMKSIASPMHLSDVSAALSAKNAAKNANYVILNDFEVTPSLLQLCGAPGAKKRSPKVTAKKTATPLDVEEGGLIQENAAAEAQVNFDGLLALLDTLIEAFEAAEQDKSKTVWSIASQSAILRTVQLSTLSRPNTAMLFYKVNTLLALHASAILNIPLAEVKKSQTKSVAYFIGLQVFTLAQVKDRL